MIREIKRMTPKPESFPIESIEIDGKTSSIEFLSNYGDLTVSRNMHKKDERNPVLYAGVVYDGVVTSVGLTVEDAEGIIEALQSMVNYIKE